MRAGWTFCPVSLTCMAMPSNAPSRARPGVYLPVGIAFAELEAQLLAAGVTTAYLAITLSWEAGLRSAETYKMVRDAVLARPAGAVPDLKLHVRFEETNLDCLDMAVADIEAGHIKMLSFNNHTPSIMKKLASRRRWRKWSSAAGRPTRRSRPMCSVPPR